MRDQQRGDVKYLVPVSQEDFGSGVPDSVGSSLMGDSESPRWETATVALSLTQLLEAECRFALIGQGFLIEVFKVQESLLLLENALGFRIGEEGVVKGSLSLGPLEDFLSLGLEDIRWNFRVNGDEGVECKGAIALVMGVEGVLIGNETP